MKLLSASVGKKILMAITGQVLVLFVIAHTIGNSTIYFDGLNAYAEHLHSLATLVWANRFVMLAVLSVHIFFGISLTLENQAANSQSYAVKKSRRASFASKNMIWTGSVIGAFLVYHLLHFTFQITNPETAALSNMDAAGRPDVNAMVIAGFQNITISIIYIISMAALLLHLSHGIQSTFQSLGLNNDNTLPVFEKAGSVMAYILFIAFILIPVVIVIGLMKG
jgi:succinate dehydrogenase / fumarate reductase cytochrome b subunit